VRLVEKIVQQPHAGEAALGHLAVDDATFGMSEGRLYVQLFERGPHTFLWRSFPKRATAVARHEWR
jgi:hypothetical protein